MVKSARGVLEEVKQVAKEDDRAYVAGRAFRRAFDKLQCNRWLRGAPLISRIRTAIGRNVGEIA